MKNRDGHQVRVIVENQQCKPAVICPHIGKEYKDGSMECAEVVDNKVTGCWLDTSMKEIGWELFEHKTPVEIKKAPFDIEWWVEGSHAYDDAELWISVIEDDDNTPYYRT